VPFMVNPVALEHDGQDRSHWLDEHELQHALLHVTEEYSISRCY
jgi:hypothetical protein